ncbi:Uncharacterised protein [Klebsiella quasivariicola]|nr:Uncharacterised protein [Klebsiella quasivariicola]
MDEPVERPAVCVQMRDDERTRLRRRGAPGVVLHNRIMKGHWRARRYFLTLLQRILYRFLLCRREFCDRVFRYPGAVLSGHLLRRDLLNSGQRTADIPVNQAVDRRSQLRHLAHDFFHDGHISRAALLHQTERLARRDGLQLVGIAAEYGTASPGRNQGERFRGVCQPDHRALIEQEQRVAEIRRLAVALLQLRVVKE